MIVHIVPTVPPEPNGLADYCFQLSQHWPDASASWGCLVLRLPQGASDSWPQSQLRVFEPSQQGLISVLQDLRIDTLILHYVGYAYHSQGIPVWLPIVLKEWKKAHPQARLVIMFHELWAGGKPWQKHFWILPTARNIVRELAMVSDVWITSCQSYHDRVVSIAGQGEKGAVIPIATGIQPSRVIAFARPWPLAENRRFHIAIFGLASTRSTALATHAALLKELCQQDLVERISLIGQSPRSEGDRAKLASLQAQIGVESIWHHAYDLSPREISDGLSQSDLGLVKETAPILTKSSVFAALCAHGVVPICAGKNGADETPDSPFIVGFDPQSCIQKMRDPQLVARKKKSIETLANSSLQWGSVAHNWKRHVEAPR